MLRGKPMGIGSLVHKALRSFGNVHGGDSLCSHWTWMVILEIAHDICLDIWGKCNATTTEANVQNCEKNPLCPILNRLQPKLIFDSEQKVILSAKGSVSLALINLVETVWRICMYSDSELESPNYFHHFSSSYFTLSTSLKLLDGNWCGTGNHVKGIFCLWKALTDER